MSFDYNTMVTDRVKADAGARNEKGTYDWRALNRVTEAMEDLHRRFTEYGYATGYVPVRIVHRDGSVSGEWREDDEDIRWSQLEQYRTNVSSLRSTFEVLKGTPLIPDRMGASGPGKDDGLNWERANDIEKILVNINTVIERTLRSFKRSNAFTFWSGNEALPCAESDRGRTWAELDGMEITWENLETADWFQLGYGRLEVAT